MVRHVQPGRQRPAAALLRLVQGEARLGQADRDRPAREAEARPRADRGRPDAVLQGDGAARRQRVLPAGEPRKKRAATRSCRARGCSIWRVVGQHGRFLEESHGIEGARGPRSFLDLGAVPEHGEQQLHARTRRRRARASSAAGCRCTSPTSASCPTAASRSTSGTSTSRRRVPCYPGDSLPRLWVAANGRCFRSLRAGGFCFQNSVKRWRVRWADSLSEGHEQTVVADERSAKSGLESANIWNHAPTGSSSPSV